MGETRFFLNVLNYIHGLLCRPHAAPQVRAAPARALLTSPCISQPLVVRNGRGLRSVATAASAAAADTADAQSATDAPARTLQLYNTMARAQQPFSPRPDNGNAVSMYVCGVTVYDYSHIGHARVYVAFDLLFRLLQHIGYDVDYVRNFTDIDDKIIKRAAEQNEDALALSSRFIDEFNRDMAALGCLPPTREPKATDHVADMVETIERIIANGHAYVADGDVFFDVKSLSGYGRLSRHQLDSSMEGAHSLCQLGAALLCTQPLYTIACAYKLVRVERLSLILWIGVYDCESALDHSLHSSSLRNAGAGGRVDKDARKRHPADFALWKSAKPGEPTWPSPWGEGRPGWHIECSSMIRKLMGPVIDIHGGGQDLVCIHTHSSRLLLFVQNAPLRLLFRSRPFAGWALFVSPSI